MQAILSHLCLPISDQDADRSAGTDNGNVFWTYTSLTSHKTQTFMHRHMFADPFLWLVHSFQVWKYGMLQNPVKIVLELSPQYQVPQIWQIWEWSITQTDLRCFYWFSQISKMHIFPFSFCNWFFFFTYLSYGNNYRYLDHYLHKISDLVTKILISVPCLCISH